MAATRGIKAAAGGTCNVETTVPSVLKFPAARTVDVLWLIGRHVAEEAFGRAADLTRKLQAKARRLGPVPGLTLPQACRCSSHTLTSGRSGSETRLAVAAGRHRRVLAEGGSASMRCPASSPGRD